MENRRSRLCVVLVGFFVLLAQPLVASAQDEPTTTPPRLSMIDGSVSFWRTGNDDWTTARINIPLAPGDALASGNASHFEIQLGRATFLRGGQHVRIQLDEHQPGYLRFRVTEGLVALDARDLTGRATIELRTPSAAFVISDDGYYRFEVDDNRTRAMSRRRGRMQVTTSDRRTRDVGSETELMIDGAGSPRFHFVSLSDLDAWDDWNFQRTDYLLRAQSRRFIGDDIYGAEELDRYGEWREVKTYGHVWVPPVAAGWSPYSVGEWIWDPSYGWTWIDAQPWGWAPFHYGRWVYVRNYWAWAPGPVIVRPAYAPALVAFFGGSGFSVGVHVGVPVVSWVPLGWGEPCVPWWGGPRFAGHPWWGGWGGPKIINRTVVHNTNINITNINVYENARDRRGVVGMPRDRFGRSPVERDRLSRVEPGTQVQPVQDVLPQRPERLNRLPLQQQRTVRDDVLTRPLVEADPAIRERAIRRTRPDPAEGQPSTGGGQGSPIQRRPGPAQERPVPEEPVQAPSVQRPAPADQSIDVAPAVRERPERRRPDRPEGSSDAAPQIHPDRNLQPGVEHEVPPPAPWVEDREQRLKSWQNERARPVRRPSGEGIESVPDRRVPLDRPSAPPAGVQPPIGGERPAEPRRRDIERPQRMDRPAVQRPASQFPPRAMPPIEEPAVQAPAMPVQPPVPRGERLPATREPAPRIDQPSDRPLPRREPIMRQPAQPPMRMEAPDSSSPPARPERMPVVRPPSGDGDRIDSPRRRRH